MARVILFGILIYFITPGIVLAYSCAASGYTIFYVNGILGTNNSALTDSRLLGDAVNGVNKGIFRGQQLSIKAAPNPSELWGADDILKTMRQVQFWNDGRFHEDADVYTILNQIHSELTTQKVLLVGHSQGTFYTNDIYYYLTTHGMSKDAVAVYNIATPAAAVAGSGDYLTSFNDSVIRTVRQDVVERPYAFGINLPLSPNFIADPPPEDPSGHLFVPSYLSAEPDAVVGGIEQALAKLKPTYDFDEQGDCFTSPPNSFIKKSAVFATDHAISTAEGVYLAGVGSVYGIVRAGAVAAGAMKKIVADINTTVGGFIGLTHAGNTNEQATDFKVYKALYGSSLSAGDVQDLLGQDQGGAAMLALAQKTTTAPSTVTPATTSSSVVGEVLGAATDTAQVAPALGALATTALELSVPIPQPTPEAAGFIPNRDMQSGPPPAAPAPEPAPDPGPSAADILAANPPVITFSNWRSPDGDQNCAVISRTFDLSWSAPPGAMRYEVSYIDSGGTHGPMPYFDDTQPAYQNFSVSLGLGWAEPVAVRVVAYDAAGDRVAGSASVNDAAPDKLGPSIASLVPATGSAGMPVDTPLRIVYNESLSQGTVSTSSIALSHLLEGALASWEPVAATVLLEGDGRTVDISPTGALLPGASYSLSASCAVKDLYGNHADALTSPVTNPQFTTAPAI